MNTVKSVYYGWATLIVAGGGAYFFAKRSINADRAAKAELDRKKRLRQYELEQQTLYAPPPTTPLNPTSKSAPPSVTSEVNKARRKEEGEAGSGNPSIQASQDPAPTRHAPEDEAREKSKYEASTAYRSRKGDRFS